MSGEWGLGAVDADGEPVDFQLLRFPTEVVLEAADPDEHIAPIDLSGLPTTTVGYLEVSPDAERIVVVDRDNGVLDERPAPGPGEAMEPGRSVSPLLRLAPSSECSHVLLIEPRDEAWGLGAFAAAAEEDATIVNPGPRLEAVITSALGRMTATHCAGVARIAVVEYPDNTSLGGWVLGHYGDLVMINRSTDIAGFRLDEATLARPDARAVAENIVVHEASHAIESLLQTAVGATGYRGEWSVSERALVARRIRSTRLRAGFMNEWERVHRGFEGFGLAGRVYGTAAWTSETPYESLVALSSTQTAEYGVMSPYGPKAFTEDLAEFVGWAVTAPVFEANGVPAGRRPLRSDEACVAMRAHADANIPASLAAVYTKLALLRDFGLITQATFDECAGPMIGADGLRPGFTILEERVVQRVFDQDVAMSMTVDDGVHVFRFTASGVAAFSGEEHPATLTLNIPLAPESTPADDVPWPRGLYELTLLGDDFMRLEMPEQPAGNFTVTDGYVLVFEATAERIRGSVFATRAWRPDAPIPVPQTFDPPLVFRFVHEAS